MEYHSELKIAQLIETGTYQLLRDTVRAGTSPVLLEGTFGSGKTTCLRMLERDYKSRNEAVAYIHLRMVRSEEELFREITNQLDSLTTERDSRPLIVSSTADEFSGSFVSLVESLDQPPVLLFDGLDEALNPYPILKLIRLISNSAVAMIVLATRSFSHSNLFNQAEYHVIQTARLTKLEINELIDQIAREKRTDSDKSMIAGLSEGSPHLLSLISSMPVSYLETLRQKSSSSITTLQAMLNDIVNREFVKFNLTDRTKFNRLLGILALRGSVRIDEAVAISGYTEHFLNMLVIVSVHGGELHILHHSFRTPILVLVGAIPASGTMLTDLAFGAEEAERDTLLGPNFVKPTQLQNLRQGTKTIVVGDRGAGKSALVDFLVNGKNSSSLPTREILAVTDPSEFLESLEADGCQLDSAEQYRAAWLLAVGYSLASQLTVSNSPKQARIAAQLRIAIPKEDNSSSRNYKIVDWIKKKCRTTSFKFKLGPIVLEDNSGSSHQDRGRKSIDVTMFLHETAHSLRKSQRLVSVAIDRVDEFYKYDRKKQEMLVQGLFLAESSLSDTPEIQMLVLIRSDLFHVYNIQEKNKLVSRSLKLQWTKDELIKMLVSRILANEQLSGIKSMFGEERDDILTALFPHTVESQAFVDWLWSSMRNGRGNIAPRQLTLLLVLSRQTMEATKYYINSLPIFPEAILRSAMTQLSELSFEEMISDFRVAPTFLRNCRAGKLDFFSLEDVRELFDEDEGPLAFQIDHLERLGFLERIVKRQSDGRTVSEFGIPALYRRCWDDFNTN